LLSKQLLPEEYSEDRKRAMRDKDNKQHECPVKILDKADIRIKKEQTTIERY
jgi:hypothetical protein